MKKITSFFVLLLLGHFLSAQNTEALLERALFDLPDISFSKLPPTASGLFQYDIRVKQPLDHQHPEKGYFFQQVRLTHHGFDLPTVIATQGYQLFIGKNEIEAMLNANHINVEHRFFGESTPKPVQWDLRVRFGGGFVDTDKT